MGTRIVVHAGKEPWAFRGVCLYVRKYSEHFEREATIEGLDWDEGWKEIPDGWESPRLPLKEEDAQHLMDSLWNCGLRPTEGSGSAGSLAATQDHLKDMQKISFMLLEDVIVGKT